MTKQRLDPSLEKNLRILWSEAKERSPGWKGATGIMISATDGSVTAAPVDYTIARRFLNGGYVELVRLPSRALLIVDEEGLLKELPMNNIASIIARRIIVGNAIYVPKEDARKAI